MTRQTFHIRGDGPQGTGDGSSYANAYGYPDFVASGNSSLGGNTFRFYGFFSPFQRTSGAGPAWSVPSGTEKQPTIVDGDDATDPCTGFWGGFYINNTWNNDGQGAWNTPTTGWTLASGVAWKDVSVSGDTLLTPVADVATCRTTDDSFFYDDVGNIMHARIGAGTNPQSTFVASSQQGNYFNIFNGVSDVIFHKVPFRLTAKFGTRSTGLQPLRVSWIDCGFRNSDTSHLFLEKDVTNCNIWDCEMEVASNGVYFYSQAITDPTADECVQDCTVKGCYIHDIGANDVNWVTGDRLGIGIQHGQNTIIEGNRFDNCRVGIESWVRDTNTTTYFRNTKFLRNHVVNSHDVGIGSGIQTDGIGMSLLNTWQGDGSGNELNYNVVDGTKQGGGNIDRSFIVRGPNQIVLLRNLAFNGGRVGVECNRTGTGNGNLSINNCGFRGHSDYFIDFQQGTSNTYVGDNNAFYGSPTNFGRWNGTNQATFDDWKTATSQDANSTWDAGIPPWTARAVIFDGTNDYTTANGIMGANSQLLTIYIRAKPDPAIYTTDSSLLDVGDGVSNNNGIIRVRFRAGTTGSRVQIVLRNAVYSIYGITHTSTEEFSDWMNMLFSMDTRTATRAAPLYFGDSPALDYTRLPDAETVVPLGTSFKWQNGAQHNNQSDILNASVSTVYVAPAFYDITQEANRRLFFGADGIPVEPPAGSIMYLGGSQDAVAWNAGTNQGTGINFTMTGAVTDAPDA